MEKLNYQTKIADEALEKLNNEHKVGLNVFTRGGKSYIAMNILEHLIGSESDRILVLGPKGVLSNLRINVMQQFKYAQNIIWLNYEKLSRKIRITDHLSSLGINPDDVKVILMDEAHKAFGKVRRETFVDDSEWIYSKYLITMTATEYNNLSGIHALYELVGKDNVIEYNHVDAIKDGVARKVKYVPAVLSYDKSVIDKINNLKKLDTESKVTLKFIKELEKRYKKLSSDEANLIRDYIVESATLPLKDGARVFVFFSKIEAIKEHKDAVIEAITSAYKAWGNKSVKYRYMELTSDKSDKEADEIRGMLGEDPLPNTIDIIFAVNMADEGIHPSRTHFALMMSATSSIQKLQQRIGRVTNLYEYDDTDTLIFDLRDSIGIINKVKYTNRIYESVRDIIVNTYEDIDKTDDFSILGEYTQVVDIVESKTAEDALDLVNKLRFIEEATRDADTVIDYIKDNLDEIDEKLNGDIIEFLRRKRMYTAKSYERQIVLGKETKYRALLNIAFSNEYDEEVQSIIKSLLSKLGYRIYIKEGTFDDIRSCNRVRIIYNECDKSRESEEITDKLINILTFNKLSDNERRIVIDFDIESLYKVAEDSGRVEKVTNEKRARDEIKRAKKEELLRQQEERERQARLKKLQADREKYINKNIELCDNTLERLIKLKKDCTNELNAIDELLKAADDPRYLIKVRTSHYNDKNNTIEISVFTHSTLVTYLSRKEIEGYHNAFTGWIESINDKEKTLNNCMDTLKNTLEIEVKLNPTDENYKAKLHNTVYDIEKTGEAVHRIKDSITTSKRRISAKEKNTAWQKDYKCDLDELRDALEKYCNIKPENVKDGYVEEIFDVKETDRNALILRLDIIDILKDENAYYKSLEDESCDIEKSTPTHITDYNILLDKSKPRKKSYEINKEELGLMPSTLYSCKIADKNKAIAVIAILKHGIALDTQNGRLSVSNASNYLLNDCNIALRAKFDDEMVDYIVEEADKCLENADSKLVLNILSGDIYTDDTDAILKELNTIKRVCGEKDSVCSNILELFRVDNLYSRYIKTLRASKGFSIYTKLLYAKSFNKEVSSILTNMFKDDINDNLELALYYALKVDSTMVYNEVFGTKKYHSMLKKYVKEHEKNNNSNEYCQVIKEILGK